MTESEIITLQENTYRDQSLKQFLDISKAWTIQVETSDGAYGLTYIFEENQKFYCLLGKIYSEYFGYYCGQYHVMDDILVLSMEVDDNINTYAYHIDEGNCWIQITSNGIFSAHTPGTVLEPKEDPWKTKEELKSIALANMEDKNLLRQSSYSYCPYFNKETGYTGSVGVDIRHSENDTQFYFGCWIDGVAPSAEDFFFEYQDGVTQYTVQGNRNRDAQYALAIHQQDAYVDVTVKRIADDYKVIPEGDYRFYLAD